MIFCFQQQFKKINLKSPFFDSNRTLVPLGTPTVAIRKVTLRKNLKELEEVEMEKHCNLKPKRFQPRTLNQIYNEKNQELP